MAFFASEGEYCGDCGSPALFSTDEYTDSLGPSPKEATPFCLECYVERHELGFCVEVHKEVNDGAAELVVGGSSAEEAERVAEEVADETGGEAERARRLDEPETVEEFGVSYVRELSKGIESRRRNIYASTSARGTVVDFETFTTEEASNALADELAKRLLDSTRTDVRIRKRAHVYDAVTDAYPVLVEHGVLSRLGVGRRAWELAKERGVSRRSKRSMENQSAGEEFEGFFNEWCEERNLTARRGKPALRRLYPEVADEMARRTDGLSGVPDFFVRGNGQRALGEVEEWRPDGEAFVEVKRGTSRMSRDQQDVVAHIKSHGFNVYVLRGEPEEEGYRFDKR